MGSPSWIPAFLGGLLGACGGAPDAPSGVLLVTLDTTRADALGCYGNPGARTPALDRLARGGVRFARAYAPAPLTLPSHASLLTGALPPEHGVHENGRQALGGELETLAEACAARGWRTAAFVGAKVLSAHYGLARGFEVYDDLTDARGVERDAAAVTDAALEWLAATEGPFFAWVHYFDPHFPYDPPPGALGATPYLAEVAHADAQLGRLLDWLERAGRSRGTLVVVTADHGEALGEHGEATHGALVHDSTLRVPLIVARRGRFARGRVVDTPVHLVDVAATICELLDWPPLAGARGRSLAPALAGEPLEPLPLYAESEYCRINFGWSPLRALVDGDWKYIAAPAPELYDLGADPGELNDVSAEHPGVTRRLAAQLEALLASLPRTATADVALDDAARAELEALGYAQGSGSVDGDASPGRSVHPRDMLAVLDLHGTATMQARAGDFAAAAAALERAVAEAPGVATFHDFLGFAYHKLGRYEDALRELETAARLAPAHVRVHGHLADTLVALDRPQEALPHFALALRFDPANQRVRARLVESCERAGDAGALIAALEGGMAHVAPASDWALRLAWKLATSPDDGLRDAARALEIAQRVSRERRDARALDVLAAAHAENGDFEKARRCAGQALDRASGAPRELVEQLRLRMALYEEGKPFRQASPGSPAD